MARALGARARSMAGWHADTERLQSFRAGCPMNSERRRELRRSRRDAKRAANRARRLAGCTLENVADLENLLDAANGAARGVRWKATVQRYMADVMRQTSRARRLLLNGEDFKRGFVRFDLVERGKLRHITAVHFSERVIQKSFARNALAPALWPQMTAGCSANIKGRGTDYAVARLKRQLVNHYRRHGSSGYVLLVDFADYFGNIDHDASKRMIAAALDDDRLVTIAYDQVDAYGERGLGLGSEPNQVVAVALPSPIDHMALRQPCVLASGRYMDDSYYIALDKGELWLLLGRIRDECERLGIVVNERKTKVVKLSRGFTFVKKRFCFTETGRVLVRPCRESITRQRRKLKRQARLVASGGMTLEQASQSYQSWRGSMKRLDARGAVRSMDALFKQLFNERENDGGKDRSRDRRYRRADSRLSDSA